MVCTMRTTVMTRMSNSSSLTKSNESRTMIILQMRNMKISRRLPIGMLVRK